MLKEARERAGLSQYQLAKKLGFSTAQFISNFERQVSPIPAKHFRKISRVLNITVDSLIEYDLLRYKERLKRRIKK